MTEQLLISFSRCYARRSLFLFETRARLFVSLSLIWARGVYLGEALDCVCVMRWLFISSFSINNTTLWFLRVDCVYCTETCLYHTVCFSLFILFYGPEENSEKGCACKLSKAPVTRARIILAYLNRASGICIRRLDTRTLPRERKERTNQSFDSVSPVRILMLNFLLVSLCPPGVMNSFMTVW